MMQRLFDAWREWMMKRGSWKMIRRDGTLDYLERFYLLKIRGHALFLHRFWADDQDGLHDHPWPWARLILSGGYFEEGADGGKHWRPRGTFSYRSAEVLHRLTMPAELKGKTWSLFYHGRRTRQWGFLEMDTGFRSGWVSARETGNQITNTRMGWLFPRKQD